MYRALFAAFLVATPAAAQSVVYLVPPANLITLLGRPLNDREGREIGRVVDIMASPDGQARVAVADIGGFMGVGSRRIAISWRLLRFHRVGDAWVVSVDTTGETVAAAPEYPGSAEGIPILSAGP